MKTHNDRTVHGSRTLRRRSLIRIRRPREPQPETTSASSTALSSQSPGKEGWIHVFRHIAKHADDLNYSNHHRAYRHRRRSLIRRSRPGQATVRSPAISNDDLDGPDSTSSRDPSPVQEKLFPHRRKELFFRRRPKAAAAPSPHGGLVDHSADDHADPGSDASSMKSLFPHRRPELFIRRRPRKSLANMMPSPAPIRTEPSAGDLIKLSCDQDDSDSVNDASVIDTMCRFSDYLRIVFDSTMLLPPSASQPSIAATPSTSTFLTSLDSALLSSSLRSPQPSPSLHSDSSVIESTIESGDAQSEISEKENYALYSAPPEAGATTMEIAGVTIGEATPPPLVDPEECTNRRRRQRRRRRRQRRRRRKQESSTPESAPTSRRFAPTSRRSAPIPRRSTPTPRCSRPTPWRFTPVSWRYTPIPRRYAPTTRRYAPTTQRYALTTQRYAPTTRGCTPLSQLLPRRAPLPLMQRASWNWMTGRRLTSSLGWRHQRRHCASSVITSSSSRELLAPQPSALDLKERVNSFAPLLTFLLSNQCYRHIWDRGKQL